MNGDSSMHIKIIQEKGQCPFLCGSVFVHQDADPLSIFVKGNGEPFRRILDWAVQIQAEVSGVERVIGNPELTFYEPRGCKGDFATCLIEMKRVFGDRSFPASQIVARCGKQAEENRYDSGLFHFES